MFAEVDLHLYRDHDADDYTRWRTEVGFLHTWDAEFYLILDQIGFYDEYRHDEPPPPHDPRPTRRSATGRRPSLRESSASKRFASSSNGTRWHGYRT